MVSDGDKDKAPSTTTRFLWKREKFLESYASEPIDL